MSTVSTKPEINFSFYVEWYDSQAELVRSYRLYYYTMDNTLEMVKRYSLVLHSCPLCI